MARFWWEAFTSWVNLTHRVARFNADGTLDIGFNPAANGAVNSFAVQADGRILVGGSFYTLGGPGALLALAGSMPTGHWTTHSIRVLAAARFMHWRCRLTARFWWEVGSPLWAGRPRNGIGRLNANGTLDTTFNPGTDGGVYSFAVQADGKILLGGGVYHAGRAAAHQYRPA